MLFFPRTANLSHKWDSERKNTSWIWLKYQSCKWWELLQIFSPWVSLALLTRLVFFGLAGSHSDHWHFLLAGTMNTLPWPLSLFLPVCLSLCPSLLFLIILFAPLSSSVVLRNVEPASNLLLPPSEFVFILTGPLPLCSTYRSISLSSLIQHPHTTFSASMLPPHSALFLSLSLSALISPFFQPFLCSLHFKLFLLLCSTSI